MDRVTRAATLLDRRWAGVGPLRPEPSGPSRLGTPRVVGSPVLRWWILAVLVLVLVAGVDLPGGHVRPDHYVALGDSYTSGPFSPAGVLTSSCLRNEHNYPSLVAAAIGSTSFRDASCISARLQDMVTPETIGPRNNPPQFNELDGSTTLVTVGIGANDIAMADELALCLIPAPGGAACRDRWVSGGVDKVQQMIDASQAGVAAVLQGIHQRAPKAAVFVVGYPAVVPSKGVQCGSGPLPTSNLPYIHAKVEQLNAMLRRAAHAQAATYIDTYSPSVGHDACQPQGVRWVEPLAADAGLSPLHPNDAGTAATARIVAAAIRSHE